MKHQLIGSALVVAMSASAASAAPIFIDFNAAGSRPENFNAIGTNSGANSLENLIDITGAATTLDVAIEAAGKRTNSSGGGATESGDAAVFGAAMSDYLYGQATGLERGYILVIFSDLDTTLAYNFMGSARRDSGDGNSRNTLYTFTGANEGSATLQVTNNSAGNVFTVDGMVPDDNGEIRLRVERGPGGNNHYYLGALRMEAVPEPASLALLGLGGLTLLSRRRAEA